MMNQQQKTDKAYQDDLKLLELAAKAAGYKLANTKDGYPLWIDGQGIWNPLTDDGDALRLAVKLELDIRMDVYTDAVCVSNFDIELVEEKYNDDPYSVTRRAIVRAAAQLALSSNEIGKTL